MKKTVYIDTNELSYEEKKLLKCNLFAIHFGGSSSTLKELLEQNDNEECNKRQV